MPPSLIGCDLKLRRADEHLAFLHGQRVRFLDFEGRGIVGEYDPTTSDYVFRVTGDPPPPMLGVIIGELAHNLRSSLDLLLWQLIELRGGTAQPFVTQFPIFENEADFDRQANRRTAGVLPEDLTFIKMAQPFNARTYQEGFNPIPWHPLALLSRLNNFDKHRHIHVAFASVMLWEHTPFGTTSVLPGRLAQGIPTGIPLGVTLPQFVPLNDETGRAVGWTFVSTEDPTEVARVHLDPPGTNPQMEMQPPQTLDIWVGDVDRRLTLIDLEVIRAFVGQVVEHFRPLFP